MIHNHPGRALEIELGVRGITQTAFAKQIKRPLKTLNQIIRGHAGITALTALQIGEALGQDPMHWMILQSEYDLQRERNKRM